MSTDSLAAAFSSTRSVLSNVARSELDRHTPCRSWTVAELINHVVVAPRMAAARLAETDPPAEEDFAAGDFLSAHDESARLAMAAFQADGALEKSVALPFGEVSGSFLMLMTTTDQFTHGWDLARATDQSTDLDRELARRLLEMVQIPPQFRGEDGTAPFGPAQTAPPDAGPADQLAAELGRQV